MKIYRSSEYIEHPKFGDLKLKVNSMWDFCSRSVCFQTINENIISYDLEECTEVEDGIVIGGTEKCKNTKWKQAEITNEVVKSLEDKGYTLAKNLTTPDHE